VYACDNVKRRNYGGMTDVEVMRGPLDPGAFLPPGADLEVIPIRCPIDSYYWLLYELLMSAQASVLDGAWADVEYFYFTEPDQRLEMRVEHVHDVYSRVTPYSYVAPHRLEELWQG
jgi:hypothetical protein